MATPARRAWLVLLVQCVLGGVAAYSFLLKTDGHLSICVYDNGGVGCVGIQSVYMGYPAPWIEFWQTVCVRPGTPKVRGPLIPVAVNLCLPAAVGLLALFLPPVIAGLFTGRSSRGLRACRVSCAAALAGIFVAWAEAELWLYPYYIFTPFQARLPDNWPAGDPVQKMYREHLDDVRRELAHRLSLKVNRNTGLYEPRWSVRPKWTILAMLLAAAASAAVIRPWRRPTDTASPTATVATTPPVS